MANPISLDSLLQGLDVPGMDGVEKAASVAVATPELTGVAKELEDHLTKQANEVSPDMSTQKGRNIAAGVMALVKRALDEGSMAPAGPNNVIAETAAQAASSTAGQQAIPKDGNITQTMQAILQNGLASGAVGPDQLYLNSIAAGSDEGNSPIGLMSSDGRDINAVAPGASMSEQVEKVAALVHLVDNGVDFDSAVTLIKQAEQEIVADSYEQEKVAAVNDLMGHGYDIETAVALVKQAMVTRVRLPGNVGQAGALAKEYGQNIAGAAKEGFRRAKNFATEGGRQVMSPVESHRLAKEIAALESAGGGKYEYAKSYLNSVAPGLAVGAAGVGGVGAAGYGGYKAMSHDKKASAIEGLVLAGYSVEQALNILEG